MPSAQISTAPAINAQDGLPQHRTFLLHGEIGITLICPAKARKDLAAIQTPAQGRKSA